MRKRYYRRGRSNRRYTKKGSKRRTNRISRASRRVNRLKRNRRGKRKQIRRVGIKRNTRTWLPRTNCFVRRKQNLRRINRKSLAQRRLEREAEKLRKMSFKFGKTIAPNFIRAVRKNKRQLTRHPYLNYLRDFKQQHPTYGFLRIMREGARRWKRMRPELRESYTQKEVLKSLRRINPAKSEVKVFPKHIVQFDYKPRSLRASRNVRKSWKNWQLLPRRRICENVGWITEI